MAEQTWYVMIPFATEESARRALHQIESGQSPTYLGRVTSAVEDDPPEYGPDPDTAEAERIGEDFDQAATDYARIRAEKEIRETLARGIISTRREAVAFHMKVLAQVIANDVLAGLDQWPPRLAEYRYLRDLADYLYGQAEVTLAPPEYDPDLAESQRIGEDFDQAATDYARIQAEED